MKKLSIVFLCAIFATFTSCEKDSENTTSKKELISSGSWKFVGMEFDPPQLIEIVQNGITTEILTSDLYSISQECAIDDILFFNSDETLLRESNLICGPEDQTINGSWNFNEDKTQIIMEESGNQHEMTIDRLTETNLDLSILFEGSGYSYTFSWLLEKK
mgnify:CR=1 FL=1